MFGYIFIFIFDSLKLRNHFLKAIAPEDQARFNNVFKSLGPDANGILGGKRARQVLTKSKLPTAALCRIWEVSDIDQDGGLSLHEFSVVI